MDELFQRAIGLTLAERRALLDAACTGRPELRQEVESLLGWDARSRSFHVVPRSGASAPAVEPTVPQHLGPYRIDAAIGSGGMGSVFRARNETTGALVAVKTVMSPEPWAVEALQREIRALTRLCHSGIVRILDGGVADGMPWYAMDLIAGVPFRERVTELRRGMPDSTGILLGLFRRLCAPLAYLHGEGIVHRDLKPENVLVLEGDRPLVVDFGLSASWSAVEGRELLEATGLLAGTRRYLAPEQLRGQLVDARADLFSLGRMLEEAVSDLPPADRCAPAAVLVELDDLLEGLLEEDPRRRIGHASHVAARLADLGALGSHDDGPAPRAYVYRSSLVGRDALLADLSSQIHAPASRDAPLTVVLGESGAGKTRILTELAALCRRRGVRVVLGDCPQGPDRGALGGAPLRVFRGALAALGARCLELGASETRRLLGAHGGWLAPLEPSLAHVPGFVATAHPPELSPAEAERRLLEALTAALEVLAGAEPLLLVIDDLQWADALSLRALGLLVDAPLGARMPLRLLAACRTDEMTAELTSLMSRATVARCRLSALGSEDARAMICEMLASTPPEPFVAWLEKHGGGNPFFVSEYLRTAIAQEWLVLDRRGEWTLSGEHATASDWSAPIPGSIRGLVSLRLSKLGRTAQGLARQACVIGRRDDLALLEAGARSAAFRDDLAELVARDVVEVDQDARFAFIHDKIREVLYDELEAPERQELHRRAALAIEGLSELAGRRGALGRHWELAGDVEKAWTSYCDSARWAHEHHFPRDAMAFNEAALALPVAPRVERVSVRNQLGDALNRFGRPGESQRQHRLALLEARRLGDDSGRAESLMGMAWAHETAGRGLLSLTMLREALGIFRRLDQKKNVGRALNNLATQLHQHGVLDEAWECYEGALKLHRELGNRRSESLVLQNQAILTWHRGELARSGELNRAGLVIAEEIEAPDREIVSLASIAIFELVSGKRVEALATAARTLETARRLADRRRELIALGLQGQICLELGRLDEARAHLRDALAIASETMELWFRSLVQCESGHLACVAGDLDEASAQYRAALESADAVSYPLGQAMAGAGLGTLARYRGRLEESRALLASALATFSAISERIAPCLCHVELGRCALAAGEDASSHLAAARQITEGLGLEQGRLTEEVAALEAAIARSRDGGRLIQGECEERLPPDLLETLRGGDPVRRED